jgi:hypothetical protein
MAIHRLAPDAAQDQRVQDHDRAARKKSQHGDGYQCFVHVMPIIVDKAE